MAAFRNSWGTLDRPVQMEPSRREILLASLALLLLFAAGTVGCVLVEGWTVVESIYMTFITLSTIGFREVHPLTNAGYFLTIGLGLAGIGLLSFVAVRPAQFLFASERLQERRIMTRINELSDHYIDCGYGRIGRRLVEDLRAEGRSVVIVDIDEDLLSSSPGTEHLYVQGNAEREETLRKAGIERA